MLPENPTPNSPEMLSAVEGGIVAADNAEADEAAKKAQEAEENTVSELWEEYDQARKFDKEARAQYAIDRRYAAGTANLNWAVSANLIGAFIEILVSFLYARNPDVSVKKAPRVDNRGTKDEDNFAKTMQIVISKLWRSPNTRLKTQCRSQVRSTLTTGIGWLKVILQCKGTNIPQMQSELNDSRKNIADLEALKAKYAGTPQLDDMGIPVIDEMTGQPVMQPYEPADGEKSQEEVDAELARLAELEASLSQRLEVAVRKALIVDFVSSENMQVSLDVSDVTENTNAAWNANAIFRPVKSLKSMFPRLTDEDIKSAKHYHQRKTKDLQPLSENQKLTGLAGGESNPDDAEMYVSSDSRAANEGAEETPFAKIVELWDKDTGHVKTMIEGVKRWAKEPYQPDYPTSRFYPYFALAFYQVDGCRHPQSLSWRLMKLQDEYCAMRSSQRLTRARAVPGVLFDATALDPVEAAKIANSTHQELIGLKPTDSTKPLRDLFAAKPLEVGDMRLYDAEPILRDMERISGVQEALAQTSQAEKTATQAEIEQTGFASRTTSDRDTLETMLTEMAAYTGELALGGLDMKDATRMAGSAAFWPHGMAIDDLLTMVEVEIEAGTTGKPKNASDKEAWGVVLPQIKEMMIEIVNAKMMGQLPIADAMTALIQETMIRMGDETDINKFIPDVQVPAAQPGMPGAPGAPGMPPPPGMPGDPAAAGVPGAVPPTPGEGWTTPPDLQAPELPPPGV